MINPGAAMKIIKAKNKFAENHPKVVAFFKTCLSSKIEEGTTVEITIQKPGEDPITTNMRITQSDLELFEGLKDLAGK